jgi:type VI secretion system protein ImpA
MTYQDFLAPLTEEDPCGPDLFDSYDPAFETYLNDAEARLPQSFFKADGSPALDPASVDPAAEWAAVSALLARTRDLRLLAAYGQFCALARDLPALADCLDLVAGLLEHYPDRVHPRISEDIIDRTNALELLGSRATVLMPLEFAPLVRDRRLREISFRRVALARGERTPQPGEETGDAEAFVSALRAAENAEAVSACHTLLGRMRAAVTRIEMQCLANESRPFRPNLEDLTTRLDDLLGLIAEARPDLETGAGDPQDDTGAKTDAAADAAAQTPQAGGAEAAPAPAGRIAGMAEARAALGAIETYFRNHEPSSPSLLLVRQAHQLVGRPLTEALDVLMPEMAGRARIDFGADSGFLLGMERMRALSEGGAPDIPDTDPPEPFCVTSRKEAAALMSAVESYYAGAEPSSPVPVLLTRARGYLNQSFAAILSDFLPARD